jgi:uncharacterized protein YjbI with pentapeptide repeats
MSRQEQYDILIRCSDRKDMAEWNDWLKRNPKSDVLLVGADFRGRNLDHLRFGINPLFKTRQANLGSANFELAHLKSSSFTDVNLENAGFEDAHLENSSFIGSNLRAARLSGAHLEGASFAFTNLQSADLRKAIVNGETIFHEGCKIDRRTDLRGVGLDNVRIDSGLKQLIEYNNRRLNWEEWYDRPLRISNERLRKLRKIIQIPVRLFWWISDYARSTGRIIGSFFILALFFAVIYYISGLTGNSIVSNLFETSEGIVPSTLVPFRAVYFSIVTMTTLGFGDMYAKFNSFWGHLFLIIQVLLGYILLAALVTRFAVLFTAGGPSGKFSKKPKSTKQNQ